MDDDFESESDAALQPLQADLFDNGSDGVELATLDEPAVAKRYTGEKLEARLVVRDTVARMLAEQTAKFLWHCAKRCWPC